MSENLMNTARLTSAQATAVLLQFADTLITMADALSEKDRREIGEMILDVCKTLRGLAQEIGDSDPGVAFEIIKSSARLVSTLRLTTNRRPSGASVH